MKVGTFSCLLSSYQMHPRSGRRVLCIRSAPASAAGAGKEPNQGAEHGEDGEQGQEAQHAEDHVGKFHVAGVGHLLTDLDPEGDDQDQRKDIEPRDHDAVAAPDQPEKDRMHDKEQQHADEADDQKVELLVREDGGKRVVERQDAVMDLRHERDRAVEQGSQALASFTGV